MDFTYDNPKAHESSSFVNPKAHESYPAIFANSSVLQVLDQRYAVPANDALIEKTKKALEHKFHRASVVEDREAALELIKTLIPKGATVNNSHSTSLEEIGFVEYLKKTTEWNNVHSRILKESDRTNCIPLRRTIGASVDYFVSTPSAVSSSGCIVLADASGSRIAPVAFTASNVILVVGAQKVVATRKEAVRRTYEFATPIEQERYTATAPKGGPIQGLNNLLVLESGAVYFPERIHVIIVKEPLGY